MSECVVQMEMPQNCETCPIRVNDSPTNVPNWICAISQWPTFYCKKSQNHANEDKYLHDCPIICQLPEGHGRLVDADKEIDFHVNDFERIKTEGIDVYSKAYSLSDLCDGITYAYDHADIIVPAEAERSET